VHPGAQDERDQQRGRDPGRDGEHRRPDAAGGGDPQILAGQPAGAGVGDQDQHGQADRGADSRAGADDSRGDACSWSVTPVEAAMNMVVNTIPLARLTATRPGTSQA
jgi:hypothetical protein